MRLKIIFFALGAWLLQLRAELPDMTCAWGLLAAVPGFWLVRLERPVAHFAGLMLISVLCAGAGFFWAAAFAHVRLADALPAEWEGKDVALVGVVASLPQPYERSVRFEFDVEQVITPGAVVPRRIALTWWVTGTGPANARLLPDLRPGQRWRLTVRLKRPHGMVNPHGFDYEGWLLERGIRATGYVRLRSAPQRVSERVERPLYWIEAARDGLRARIHHALPDKPYAGVLIALAIGDQRAISAEQWQIYTRTGVNHLMSISGLHITMVSGLVFAIAYGLWRRCPGLTLRLPARKAAVVFGLAGALVYTLLSGYAVPAQRTLYMLAVVAAALWFGVSTPMSSILAAALLVVVLVDPWAVLSPGFWLSFGAVAIILFVSINRAARAHWLISWAKVQWAVTLALVPLLLGMFQQVSLVSPVANAFAIPVISLGVVPLTLAGIALPFDLGLNIAHRLMAGCMVALEWLSALPDAVWQQHAPPPWAIACALAGAVWLLLPRGVPARALGAIAMLPLFAVTPPLPAQGDMRVTVLDVGQGLSVVVQTSRHALLFDTGPPFGPGADSGNRIIVPYLRASGVRRLDGMIVSHDDNDHSGGALSVLQAMPVDWLMSSLPDFDPLPLQAEEAVTCYQGQNWEWDGVTFQVLYPAQASYDDPRIKDNNRSCVLKVTSVAGSILLPADIERYGEEILVAQARTNIRSDVLVAPHQGSRTSSTADFIAAVSAKAVVIPAGYRNRFGHPHQEVVDRYRNSGVDVYRTDGDGAVLVNFAAQSGISIEGYRARSRRYWHDAPEASRKTRDSELDRAIY